MVSVRGGTGIVVARLGESLSSWSAPCAVGTGGVGWGFQMQSPGFVLGTCVLMIVLGLSLAGVFEIGTGLCGVSAGDGDGRTATFLSGVLATVVATPCTAPGLGAALGFALDKDRSTAETLLFFTVI